MQQTLKGTVAADELNGKKKQYKDSIDQIKYVFGNDFTDNEWSEAFFIGLEYLIHGNANFKSETDFETKYYALFFTLYDLALCAKNGDRKKSDQLYDWILKYYEINYGSNKL